MFHSWTLITWAVFSFFFVPYVCNEAQIAIHPTGSASDSKDDPKSEKTKAEARSTISFEKTVYDLGDVGQGTKNTCEFRFTNTGRGQLKIGKISRTCGCTVFQLDKKEYAPNETGTIKVIYTAGKSTGSTQKSIYISTNDKNNPEIKLTITGRFNDGTVFEATDTIKVIDKIGRKSPN